MISRMRLLRNVGIGLAALLIFLLVVSIWIVQTEWFRNYVKQKIIASTEDSVGGRVEVGSFQFDWRHLRAVVTGFVVHGDEPPEARPFLRAPRIQLDLGLFSSMHHLLALHYLAVQQPEANIMVLPNGRSNIPTPRQPPQTNGPPLQAVVNAAIDHFELTDATIFFAEGRQMLDIRGNNLQAQLWYSVLRRGYDGRLSFEPLCMTSGRDAAIAFKVALPVAIQSDRVDFKNASITTPNSTIQISGSVQNLRNPTIAAHVNGHIALVDLKNAADVPLTLDERAAPSALDVDANATLATNNIQVNGLRIALGHSDIEASGTLKNPKGSGALAFKSTLALGELSRLMRVAARAIGTVSLNGTAKLDANNNYDVNGDVTARRVSFQQDGEEIENVDLFSALHVDPHNIDLRRLRLAVFGGDLAGNLSVQDLARFQFHGDLKNLNLRTWAQSMGEKQFPYDGNISGRLDAEGNLKATPIERGLTADARFAITPGTHGVPVSGNVNADYNGAADNLRVDNSYIALPHTRLTFNGSVGNQLHISVATSDLKDLLVATAMNGKSAVTLNGHEADFRGAITGRLTSPRIAGHLKANHFSIEGREFDNLDVDANVSPSAAALRNGTLTRGAMQTLFAGQVGLKDWRPTSSQAVSAQAMIRNGDLADLVALAERPSSNYSGALTANLQMNGTVGDPTGSANLLVTNAALYGEPFDRIQAQVNLADQLVTVPSASVEASSARLILTADYRHPRDSFTSGQLHAHVQSNQVDLAQLRNLQKEHPETIGMVQVNVDVSGKVAPSEFQLTAVNGDVSAHGLRFQGEDYGDLNATARTTGQALQYRLTSNFAGSSVQVNGNTQLTREYPTTADASIRALPVERVLAVAQRKDIPAKGNLSGTAHFAGTKDNPQGNVDLSVTNAVVYDEPLDHARLVANYEPRTLEIREAQVSAGPARIELTGRFEHPEGNLESGSVQFQLMSSGVDLARIHNVESRRPGLAGMLQLNASGAAEVRASSPRVLMTDLNANVAANGIAAQGKNYGDLTLTASTAGGKTNFVLASNLAGASIHGQGSAELADPYPVDAQVAFSNVAWTRVRDLIGQRDGQTNFEVTTDGQVNLRGSALKPEDMHAALELSRLELSSIAGAGPTINPVSVKNEGPITAALDRQTVRIDRARLTGPQTDIQASGTVSLKDRSMNVALNANANLALLKNFDRDIESSGTVVLAATVRGAVSNPLANGKLEVHNGSFNYTGFSNGISNANGVVALNGNAASVQNLTAESGGGKLSFGGFVVMAGNPRFGLRMSASSVRVELQPGVSIAADGNLTLAGTQSGSELSGKATITRIAYAPRSDLGSLLTRVAPPVQAAATPSSLLDNMKLDIRVQSSDALLVRASLAQDVEGQADLRIRGTASHPGVLGRVTITSGTLTFFGANYAVNSGTIAFYDPVRIDPVLDISLETHAQGVDVTLRVTGPVDNMKVSYTSDPPLRFEEIIALLGAGHTPTSDPTLLANQPSQSPQTFQQMGESALLTGAVADPLASRLQRVFGVSQLRISPTFTTGTELPSAAVTLQQRVANNIMFTYASTLNNANAQTIAVEVTINPQWSAVATRDENGILSVNLLYKRQIR